MMTCCVCVKTIATVSAIGPLCTEHAVEFYAGLVAHMRFLRERRRILEAQPINFDELALEREPVDIAV